MTVYELERSSRSTIFVSTENPYMRMLFTINRHNNLTSIALRYRDKILQSPIPSSPPQFEPRSRGDPFEFSRRKVEALCYFSVKRRDLSSVVLSQYTHVTDDRQTTTTTDETS